MVQFIDSFGDQSTDKSFSDVCDCDWLTVYWEPVCEEETSCFDDVRILQSSTAASSVAAVQHRALRAAHRST